LSGNVYDYYPEQDFNEEFWRGVYPGYKVYHGTTEENLPDIQQHGLEPRDKTRGISNRSTGSGVFTSDNVETAQYSYDIVLEIDVGQMKQDGYMPVVGMEDPVEESELEGALAHAIGIEDYDAEHEQGLDPGTVIFRDVILPKYLRVVI